MDDMRQKLFPIFLQEAEQNLAKLDRFLSCNKATGCIDEMEAAFRAAHTLKGTALLVQAESIHKIARRLEALLEKHYSAKSCLTLVEKEALQLAVEWLRPLIAALQGDLEEPKQFVVEALQALDLAEKFPGKTPLIELLDSHSENRAPALDDPFSEDPDLAYGENEILRLNVDPFEDDPGFGTELHLENYDSSATDIEEVATYAQEAAVLWEEAEGTPGLACATLAATETGDLPYDPFAEDTVYEDDSLTIAQQLLAEVQVTGELTDVDEETSSTEIGVVNPDELPIDPFAEDPGGLDAVGATEVNPADQAAGQAEEEPEDNLAIALKQADAIAESLLLPESEALPRRDYRCCAFQVDGREYFLPIEQMQEISDLPALLPLPLAPPMVSGLINLRGQVIPVIDLALLNQHKDTTSTRVQRLVVAEHRGEQLAFLADGVPYLSEDLNGEKVDLPKFLSLYRARGVEE